MPEIRGYVYRRVFLTRRTAAFDLALAGALLAAAMRSPWPAAAAAPYLVELARAALPWRRHAPGAFAATFAADAVTFIALIRGSVRERTLLI
jgi:hypothetical protein